VAVFAQAGVVHGLGLASGQALWTYTDGLSVYGNDSAVAGQGAVGFVGAEKRARRAR